MRWGRSASRTRRRRATSAGGLTSRRSRPCRRRSTRRGVRVWRAQPAAFFDEAVIDADGTLAETTGRVQRRDGHRLQRGVGLSPAGGVAGQHAGAVVPRQPQRQSPVGGRAPRRGSIRRGRCVATAGFRRITFRGDTDFSQTRAPGSLGRGRRAVRVWLRRPPESDRAAPTRCPPTPGRRWSAARRTPIQTEPRQRPANVKAATIVAREFKNLRLEAEAVAEFPYQPTACATTVPDGGGPQEHLGGARRPPPVRSDPVFLLSDERSGHGGRRRSCSWRMTGASRKT